MTIQEQFKEHYASKENGILASEHKYFLNRCKKRGLIIEPRLEEPEAFARHAKKSGYLIGQKPIIVEDKGTEQKDVRLRDVAFVFTATIGKRVEENGRKVWTQVPNPSGIKGFGIELNLLGWSKLLGKTLDELAELLKVQTIEQIYATKSKAGRKSVRLDGVCMSVNEALEKTGCDKRTYWRAIDEIADARKIDREAVADEIYQAVFDDLLKRLHRQSANLKQQGVAMFKALWWIHVSNEDKEQILQQAKASGQSPSVWLHQILQPHFY